MAAAFGEAASQQLFVYSEIGPWGIGAEEFAASLAGVDGDIEIHVNSPGGNAFDGLAIYSQLQARPGRVRVVVDGLAASIASVICQAASPGDLVVSPSSVFMIHEAWVDIAAGASELRKQADVLDGMNSVLASIYSDRSGRPQSYWRQAMNAETWYSAPEAGASGPAGPGGDQGPSAGGAGPDMAGHYASPRTALPDSPAALGEFLADPARMRAFSGDGQAWATFHRSYTRAFTGQDNGETGAQLRGQAGDLYPLLQAHRPRSSALQSLYRAAAPCAGPHPFTPMA